MPVRPSLRSSARSCRISANVIHNRISGCDPCWVESEEMKHKPSHAEIGKIDKGQQNNMEGGHRCPNPGDAACEKGIEKPRNVPDQVLPKLQTQERGGRRERQN
jgi:hypothetical protein